MDGTDPRAVIYTGQVAPSALRRLEAAGLVPIQAGATDAASLRALVAQRQPEAIILRAGQVDRSVIKAADKLKIIAKHGVGVDNIDLAAAAEAGIVVTITPRTNERSVAEHALTLVLAMLKGIDGANQSVRANRWKADAPQSRELTDKVIGFAGYGRIARDIHALMRPFGVHALAYDPFLAPDDIEGLEARATLADLLAEVDILSLHCPLTAETKGMIGAHELSRMKPDALIVNTARGGLIDETALATALTDGALGGAALDVFETEPPSATNPLSSAPRVILTPHLGGSSVESLERTGQSAAESVIAACTGAPINTACVICL